jgi:hypothetical protein
MTARLAHPCAACTYKYQLNELGESFIEGQPDPADPIA